MQTAHAIEDRRNGDSLEREARSPSVRLPLARLLQLLLLLQSERFPNASRLAEACAVSRRTIYRDLTILEAAGIEVMYQPQRQGYQLVRDGWLQPTQLDDNEALALLVISRIECAQIPSGLARHARSGLTKVLQSLPAALRDRLAHCSELIRDEIATLEVSPDRRSVHETILRALSQRRRLALSHRQSGLSDPQTTKLSVYRLARVGSQWVLVGHSSADREVRVCPVPWIEHLELTDEPYTIPPRFNLERYLKKSSRSGKERLLAAQLRFSSRVASAVSDMPRQRQQRLCAGPDGSIDLFLNVADLDEVLSWVIRFGDQVEVLEPSLLRSAVRDWAERVARIHSPRPE
jgi:predicted DNA-binding transcriptional regulator YafY